jgi:hypothetical protein
MHPERPEQLFLNYSLAGKLALGEARMYIANDIVGEP